MVGAGNVYLLIGLVSWKIHWPIGGLQAGGRGYSLAGLHAGRRVGRQAGRQADSQLDS